MNFYTVLHNPALMQTIDADTVWELIDEEAYITACEIQSPNSVDFDQVVTGQAHRLDTMLEAAYLEFCAKQHPPCPT